MGKLFSKLLSFRSQIVIIVVALSVLPLVLFGFHSIYLAGKSQSAIEDIKYTILVNLTNEIKEYFIRLNKNLSFTRVLETMNVKDNAQITKVLLDGLSSNREIVAIGYINNNKLKFYFGEDSTDNVERRVGKLLVEYMKKKWIQISSAYQQKREYLFDLLYPLENGSFVYLTYTMKELEKKLASNNIGETGKFAVIKENGDFIIGSEDLEFRFNFLKMSGLLNSDAGNKGSVSDQKRGYQIKAYKINNIMWPLWIVFTQKATEANILTRQLKLGSSIILGLMLMISGGLSFTLAKNFSRPIDNLLKAVKKNHGGDLEAKADLDERDSRELTLLIRTFNEMIDNLRETQEKLVEKEKMAVVGEMANVIGHDIRNPLAAIKNGAFYLKHVLGTDNERIVTTLGIIDREIENIQQIVEDLLGYSRQRPPALAPVDVGELIEEVISIIETPSNVSISTEIAEDLPEYNLDKGEIRQTLVNLVNNAVQACEHKDPGEVKVISCRAEDGNLKILIRDNGIGIPKEKMRKVFQAFFSTKQGGTGLGLASAKRIVERHDGIINMQSEQGKGTEIIISIPQKKIA